MTLPGSDSKRTLQRVMRVAAVVASVAILGVTAFSAGVDSLLERIDSGTAVEEPQQSANDELEATDTPKPLNILIMGSDTRDGQGEGFGSLAAYGGSARSDTTILIHLSGDRSRALVVSVPRDSMVEIPACATPSGGTTSPTIDRFNVAFALGGPTCTIQTFEQLTGIKIDHWATIDFNGFINVVNALGGVEVCLDRAVKDRKSKLDLPAGRTNVDGDQALAFVRARFNIGDGGDLSRIRRQQAFLASVVRKASSTQLLLNPIQLIRVIDATTKSVSTDSALADTKRIREIALSVSGIEPSEVRFVTVPSRLSQNRATVEWTTRARRMWQAIRNDQPWPPSSAEEEAAELAEQTALALNDPASATLPPSQIKIEVLNGAGIAGIARRTSEELKAAGFDVVAVGDASGRVSATRIEHGPLRVAGANTLSAWLGGVELVETPGSGEVLRLTIGPDTPRPKSPNGQAGAPSQKDDPDAVGVTDATDVFCAS